jgi:hypothetical protein
MLAPVTHILPLTTVRRERLLPVPGKVLVRKGQKVGATDTIAEANLAPEHILLDLGRGLGIPAKKVEKYVQIKVGFPVAEGDIVAGPAGMTRRVVRAPHNGRVIQIEGGKALLEVQGQPFGLKAAIPGIVADLVPDRGAVIETTGALVQGVWGNGGIEFGLMYVLATSPDHLLTPDRLDVSLRGSIILAGHCEIAETLKTAEEMPLRGVVLSSMSPALIPVAAKLRIPVMIIEGFGRRPMNSAAFKLLTTNERREIALNGESWDRYAGTRPEVVIPLPAASELPPPRDADFFGPGQQVRVLRAPYAGKIGTLMDLPGLVVFPSGIRALAGEVHLENGESAVLPLANLEVLE